MDVVAYPAWTGCVKGKDVLFLLRREAVFENDPENGGYEEPNS